MTTLAESNAPPVATPYRWRWVALFVILAAEVMDLTDSTVVNVAAPSIRSDLGGTYSAIQWIAAGYTLAFAVMLITGGRLGDIFGRRNMFVLGAAGFTLASAVCALAVSPEMLIASRVAQGAFGAVLIPQGFGVIRTMFPAKELPAAFGLFGPVMGLSAVCGPILAGWLVDADYLGSGWRMIFLINVPLGAAAVIGALVFMPGSTRDDARSPERPRLDLPGMALVTIASLMLIYPLVQGREHNWPLWTYALLVGSLPVFALFAWYEARRSSSPLIQAGLFANRAFTAGVLVIALFFCAVSGLMLSFGVFTQNGLGFSPLKAGLAMVPWALGVAIGATISGGAIPPRFGRTTIQSGLAVMAVGFVAIVVTVQHYGSATTAWTLVPAMATCGLGMGLGIAPLFSVVLAGVADHEVGTASGVLNALQQLGGSVGIAVLGTVFFDQIEADGGFLDGMRYVSWLAVALTVGAVAVSVLLPREARPDDGH
jgi:EmrB/QacA subfamily drug resistance transporter